MQTSSPNIKKLQFLIISLTLALCVQTAARADIASDVKTDKDVYGEGETIRVSFSNAPGSSRDWICIVAAESPDTDAGDFQYMPNRASQGELTFNAHPPGKYEVRAFYNYSRRGYVVSARHGFTIVDGAPPVKAVAAAIKTPTPERPPAMAALPAVATGVATGTSGAIFHFTPLNMDAAHYGIAVTNTLHNNPKIQASLDLLGRRDLEIFLAANNLQQNDQLENIVEIGTKLGLNFVIAGSIGKKGALIVTNIKVVSIARKNIIFKNQFTAAGETDLISRMTKMGDAIADAILGSAN